MSILQQTAGRTVLALAFLGALAAVFLIGQVPWAIGRVNSPAEQDSAADIIALTVELAPGHEGIALIDKTHYTLSVYQYQPSRPAHERLVLLAARCFRYDLQLEAYNTASPTPKEVKMLLERSQRIQSEIVPPSSSDTTTP